ncbi:MAG: N-acetyltransferase [Dehalococcoidia bacterium]|nr:N-acetyltransferase [Dehalococcoidia bacterium]
MCRDLTVPFSPSPAKIEFTIEPLDASLAPAVFSLEGLDAEGRRELANRRRMWEEGLPTAYVAIDLAGNPCYFQWALSGVHDEWVHEFFGGGFPRLAADELLLEGAWGLPAARGQRIMGEAMSRITEMGAGADHRRAITFVGVDNEPSLRGCRTAGFEVYIERHESWRLGRRQLRWAPPATPASS